MIAHRIGIHRGGAYASGCRLAADDERADAELREMRRERRAIECARALLGDHDIARLRLELRSDRVIGCLYRRPAALGRTDEVRPTLVAGIARGIEDRQAGAANRGKQALRRLDRLKSMLSAGIRMALGQLCRWQRPAGIDRFIQVYRQKSRIGTDEHLALITGIGIEIVLGDHVLPTMVFKSVGHVTSIQSNTMRA